MLRSLLLALSLAAAGPALAQTSEAPPPRTYTQADIWSRSGDRIRFTLAGISVPAALGTLRFGRTAEASREGQALDNALLYASADQAVFATVYIYAPALPDAALTAFMTDHAIHLQSGSELRVLRRSVAAAGGREGVAIRADYAGFRQDRLASSAAFLRVGRWIVKLRVSGPEARRAEVEEAMNSLLRDIRFEGRVMPAAATPIAVGNCERAPERAGRPMPSEDADTMEDAIMAVFLSEDDVAEGRSAPPPPARVGPGWCRSEGYSIPDALGPTPVLRDPNVATGDDIRHSIAIALWGDNGTMLEVVERRFRQRRRFVLVHHQIGQTTILGAYDAVPTDAQLRDVAMGTDREGGRIRASIVYRAGGGSDVNLGIGR
ncbi:MAG TPA: hypothetical protein VEC11_13560 [Allosphingosinicella sp.]|nr:hypothetical protein [Allosphingosinicella sp.]